MCVLRHWQNRRLLLASAVLIFLRATAGAHPDWLLRTWQSDDGLPNNNVTGLAQTDDGYLWIANPGNLARFDGVSFDTFPSARIAGIDQKVTSVLRGRSGGLWLGMDHGALVYLNAGKTKIYTNDVPNLIAWTLTEDREGALWIFYGGSTICRFKDGQVTRLADQNDLAIPPRLGYSIVRDGPGHLWFANGGTLARLDNGHFTPFSLPQTSEIPVRLAGARDGGAWICAGFQLSRCDENGKIQVLGRFQPDQPGTEPTVLLEDRHGAVWIGTSSSGLFRYGPDGFENIPVSHGRISSILEDREGYIWVGTGGGGLIRIEPRAIEIENAETGFSAQAVQSVCEDAQGVSWATTENGLLMTRANGAWQVVSTNADWPGGLATSVAADPSGAVWIGTRRHQLICCRDGKFTAIPLPSLVVHALTVASNGDLWIGEEVPENLQRLRNGQLQTFTLPPNIRVIRAMTEDAAGNVWLGTSKGVLLRVTGDQVADETAHTTGAPLSIRGLQATADGSLWIGYVGGGVGRFKDGRFARIDSTKGLYDDIISEIVADDQGWLWFGCDHGIFKVRRQELDAVAEERAAKVRCIHYGRDDGLPSLQANFGDAPGAIRTRDGRLWLPLRTGVAVADPGILRKDLPPPPALLKRIVVDDDVLAYYGGVVPVDSAIDPQKVPVRLRLKPGHHHLQFEFTALTPGAAGTISFRYRLDGIDDNWIEAGTQRTASYSRLAAGDYLFHVTACNNSGVWNKNSAIVAVSVAPFFWQTWWFRISALALFTSGAVGIARYVSFRRLRLKLRELEQKAALDKERARIAKDIHDDLGGNLTQAALLLNLTRKNRADPQKLDGYLGQISSSIRGVVESLDEIVWAVNPGNDLLPHLVDYIGQFAVEFLRTANLRYHLDLPDDPPNRPLAPEVRHNLFLVLKEALNNTVRHAEASEVRLSLKATPDWLNLVVEDDGKGFNGAPTAAGADGLRNMRQRMQDIGGRCEIVSAPGTGTRVEIFLPWPATKSTDAPPNSTTTANP